MPRQRSAGRAGPARAPARPTAPAPTPAPQQQRPAATMAAPPPQAHAPPAAASQGPGLFGQMASTAAGVAVGSSIGHAIGGMFGGSSAPAEAAPQAVQATQQQPDYNNTNYNRTDNCASAATDFTRCMDEQGGNMQICNWYLEQLKACQAAAKPY
ncbi:CHCH domain protein [Sarocladium implicatum]|nr:CHCH domain protein [Sarocladium implicatum]